jgi:hypothetical protein
LVVIGVVDDEGVGERERRDNGERERERDLDETDEDDDDDDDRLIDVFVFCSLDDDEEDDTTSAFVLSERGVGRKDLSANVLTVFIVLGRTSLLINRDKPVKYVFY